jgi:hypothetical protein
MSQEIRNLEPKALWNKSLDLAVPRPSKDDNCRLKNAQNLMFEDENS